MIKYRIPRLFKIYVTVNDKSNTGGHCLHKIYRERDSKYLENNKNVFLLRSKTQAQEAN